MINAPEKLHSAFKMYTPMAIKGAVADAELRKTKTVLVPMRRGAAEFMSNEQYEEFYWPYLKQLLIGLVEADLRPVAIFEGECDGVLEFLPELPPGKIIGHFDKIDRRKAKRLIGNVMCFWGNVSSSLLCHGTPREVRDDVKELIDIFGDNGGLIVDGAMGIPDDAKPENVQAMTEAAHEFGVF
jgi:uroporphyrinogen-III decarboxylase